MAPAGCKSWASARRSPARCDQWRVEGRGHGVLLKNRVSRPNRRRPARFAAREGPRTLTICLSAQNHVLNPPRAVGAVGSGVNEKGAATGWDAKDLQLDGDARQQCRHDAGGDQIDGRPVCMAPAAPTAGCNPTGEHRSQMSRRLSSHVEAGHRRARRFAPFHRRPRVRSASKLGVRAPPARSPQRSGWFGSDPPPTRSADLAAPVGRVIGGESKPSRDPEITPAARPVSPAVRLAPGSAARIAVASRDMGGEIVGRRNRGFTVDPVQHEPARASAPWR